MTKDGLLAAAAGGSLIGVTFVLLGFLTAKCQNDVALKQLLVIPLSALAGLCGSLIDSLLGATLQFSGFCSVRKKVTSNLHYFTLLGTITNKFVLSIKIVGKPGPTVKKISGLDILDNNAVNFVSILLTTFLTGIACSFIF